MSLLKFSRSHLAVGKLDPLIVKHLQHSRAGDAESICQNHHGLVTAVGLSQLRAFGSREAPVHPSEDSWVRNQHGTLVVRSADQVSNQ